MSQKKKEIKEVKKQNIREYDMVIRIITKSEKETVNGEITKYRLMARDKDGLNEIIIVSATPFSGLSAKDGVIQLVIKNSQLSIDDFKDAVEEGEDKSED